MAPSPPNHHNDNRPHATMSKEEYTLPLPLEKWRVTPAIHKRKRSQEELIDQPQHRSKCQPKCSNSIYIAVTPALSSSIQDSASISSISGANGDREYMGSRYSLEEELSKQAPSSPEHGHGNATEIQGDKKSSNDSPQHCYCDEYCQSCTSNTLCELHDDFFCSGCDD
jgi:hypothetical protein